SREMPSNACRAPSICLRALAPVRRGLRAGREATVPRYTIFMCVVGALGASLCDASALTINEAYASVSLSPPTTRLVVLCHDFGCAQRTPVGLSSRDL